MNHKPPVGRGPYQRPMAGWWQRNPFFMRYMLREATAVAVGIYAVVLTAGLWRLSQGEAAWNAWLQALRSPWSLALHVLLLLAMFVHTRSWFEIMPKTLPFITAGGQRVAAATITRGGWALAALVSALVLALAWWA
jgi:fumarate reductase subunit C